MTVACEVVDIVYTAAFCLLWILLCWQSQRRWLRIPVRSTERCADHRTLDVLQYARVMLLGG